MFLVQHFGSFGSNQEVFGQEKFCPYKFFWSENFFWLFEKIFGLKNSLVKKNFWSEKSIGSGKKFDLKHFLVQKHL